MNHSPIRLLIVDDHAMMRMGLRSIFMTAPDIDLVGEATNGEQALAMLDDLKPTVVLTDLKMPTMDGPTLIAELTRDYPEIHVIALTSFADESLIKEVVASGSQGYLLKDTEPHFLVEGIRRVSRGERVFSPTAKKLFTIAMEAPPRRRIQADQP